GRIRAGRLTLNRVPGDLGKIVDVVLARLESQIERSASRVAVTRAGDLSGEWDPSRAEQVVTNLMTNALKYGAGAPIEVAVEGAADLVTITVCDHGIGIAAPDQARIFGRFERAVSVEHFGGLGLGLFIVREIVEAH